jgi:hypothetical protein
MNLYPTHLTNNKNFFSMNFFISSRLGLSAIVALLTIFSAGAQIRAETSGDKSAPLPSSPGVSAPTLRLRSFTIIVRDYDEAKN